jgi:hypothetical protein
MYSDMLEDPRKEAIEKIGQALSEAMSTNNE